MLPWSHLCCFEINFASEPDSLVAAPEIGKDCYKAGSVQEGCLSYSADTLVVPKWCDIDLNCLSSCHRSNDMCQCMKQIHTWWAVMKHRELWVRMVTGFSSGEMNWDELGWCFSEVQMNSLWISVVQLLMDFAQQGRHVESGCGVPHGSWMGVLSLFSGRNALHLAAKYGHALCLQKLLQVLKNPTCLCLLF